MSAIATETSFDALVETIKLGARSSRASSYSSTLDGSMDSTPPRKSSLNDPRDSGVWGATSSDSSPQQQSKPAGKPQYEVVQHQLQQPLRRPESHLHTTPLSPTSPSRTRSDSMASAGSTDKPAHHKLRHGMGRPGALREEQQAVQPESLAKIMLEAPRLARAQQRAGRPGCILSSAGEMQSLQGRSGAGRPVWWCRFDNMVVFDGMALDATSGEVRPRTRSSKGLPVANAKGRVEIVRLELECGHCKDVLHLSEWKYAARVCSRGVCAACRVRCAQEHERGLNEGGSLGQDREIAAKDFQPAEQQIIPAKREDRPAKEQPTKEQPTKEQPTKEQPTKEQPTNDQSAKDQPIKAAEPIAQKAQQNNREVDPITTPVQSPARIVALTQKKVKTIERIPEHEEEPSEQRVEPVEHLVEAAPEPATKLQAGPEEKQESIGEDNVHTEKESAPKNKNTMPSDQESEPVKQHTEPVDWVLQLTKKNIDQPQEEPLRETLEADMSMRTGPVDLTEPLSPKALDQVTDDGLEGLVVRNLDLEYQPSQPLVATKAGATEDAPAAKNQGFLSGWRKGWK